MSSFGSGQGFGARRNVVGTGQERRHKRESPCFHFQRGYCRNGEQCQFRHDSPASVGGYGNQERNICRNFQMGNCRYGDRCRYSHGQGPSPEMSGGGVSSASNAAGWVKAGFGGGGGNFGMGGGFSSGDDGFGSSQTAMSRGGGDIKGLGGGVGFGSLQGVSKAGGFGAGPSVAFGPGFSVIGGKNSAGNNGGFGVGGFPRLGVATTSGGGFASAGPAEQQKALMTLKSDIRAIDAEDLKTHQEPTFRIGSIPEDPPP